MNLRLLRPERQRAEWRLMRAILARHRAPLKRSRTKAVSTRWRNTPGSREFRRPNDARQSMPSPQTAEPKPPRQSCRVAFGQHLLLEFGAGCSAPIHSHSNVAGGLHKMPYTILDMPLACSRAARAVMNSAVSTHRLTSSHGEVRSSDAGFEHRRSRHRIGSRDYGGFVLGDIESPDFRGNPLHMTYMESDAVTPGDRSDLYS